jgi:predicted transcriptional regulator
MQPHEIYSLRARDVMNRQFVLVSPLDTVHDAITKMKACGNCQVAIVDRADEDDAYGMMTFQEMVYRVISKSLSPTRTRVGEIMIKPLIVVNPTLRLPFVAQLFSRFGIQNAIVIEQHQLVGVISSADMVMALTDEKTE